MKESGFDHSMSSRGEIARSREHKIVPDFEDLAMPLLNSSYNLARWLTRNDTDAEDLLQETYLKAFRNYNSFEPGTNFRAWIFRILRNTFLSSCATLERRMTVALDCDEDSPWITAHYATPESLLIDISNITNICDAIDRLPISYREVILLCDVEEFTYREIAEILAIPIGTVMSRLSRSRKSVRNALRVRQPNQITTVTPLTQQKYS